MVAFNDTNLSGIDFLTRIEFWMKETYDDGVLLPSIVYPHHIADNRMEGSKSLNSRMLESLCG